MPLIYHSCSVANLRSVLQAGGLWAKNLHAAHGIHYVNVAHGNIQSQRYQKAVPLGPGGNLHDYVPFYFNPRSPMLYAIHRGAVSGCSVPQREMVHLESSDLDVQAAGIPFVFTDGHAIMSMTRFFDQLVHMNQVDWAVMALQYWANTAVDNDRQRRRQAEFLVHHHLPWPLIKTIHVIDQAMASQVQGIIQGYTHQPPIRTSPSLYYY